MPRPWGGRRDSGPNAPSELHRAAIVQALREHPEGLTMESLSAIAHVPGRTARQVVSDCDGVEFVLAISGDQVYIAQTRDAATTYTRRLRRQATALMERVKRREGYAKKLGGTGSLFAGLPGFEDEGVTDD